MSNTGAPQFPQPGQYRPEGQQRAFNSDFRVGNLDKAPNEIRAEITAQRKAVRLEGEITRVNQDGSVRVATERGDVDVRLTADERHQQRPPQVGQRVEIEIQPPPRNAPEQLPQVTIRPAAPSVETNTSQPNTRVSETPVQVEVRDGQTVQRPEAQIVRPEQIDPNALPPRNTFPEAGSLVRLEPVSPQQLEQLIQTRQVVVAETVRNALPPLPVLDVLPAQQQQPATPVTTQVHTQQSAPQNLVTSQVFVQPQVQNITVQVAAPSQQSTQAQQTLLHTLTPTLNTAFTQNAAASENQISVPVLTRAQAAVAQLQNSATNTAPVLEIPQIAAPQDARVGTIQPPQVTLRAPNQVETQIQNTAQNPVIGTQKAAQITGTVVAKTQTQVPIVQFSTPQNIGQPIVLNTPISPVAQQTYALQFPSDTLILGSRIDVTPQSLITTTTSATQPSALTSALPTLPYSNIAFPQPWPVMQDIQQSLLQVTTQAAAQTAQAFNASIPSPANISQFGPAALFFVAAARGGDLGSWLGDKASEILRSNGKGSLLSRLNGEAGLMSRASEAPSGEWRGMNIPLMWDGDIQKIALHYKHDSAGGEDDTIESNKGTRFVFDLSLDVMGKVQLDGFFRPVSSDGPRLDIVLRTEERFSGAMQQEMRRLYMDAIKPSQVGGELSFQDGIDAWVMIDAEDMGALGVSA